MRIINEKGKLFGLINVVDLLVLLVVVCVCGTIAFQLAGNKINDAVSEQVELTAQVVVIGCPVDLMTEIERQNLVGEKLVAGTSYVDAYISDIWYKDYIMQNTRDDGMIVSATDPKRKDVVFEIKATVPADTAVPKVANQEMRAGRTFILKTQTFESSGTIYYLELGE